MRVLVVDDHEVVRRGVRSLLESNYEVCGEAIDGRDALEQARRLKPDIVVMDVSMPNLNGLEATRQIRKLLPDCEVLIMSQHEVTAMVREAFKAGARGYVVKSSLGRDLLNALDTVSRHQNFFDPAIPLAVDRSSHVDAQEVLQRSAALEQALRESEELYRSTFDLAAVGVAHVSPEGQWLRVNDKVCQIVGYSRDELLQTTFQDITHPDDLPADLVETEKVRTGELNTFSMEKRYIRKDGSIVWVNLTVSGARDAKGQLKHFISLVEDISERRKAEDALRESQAQLALALESTKTATFEWDVVERRGPWNQQMAAIYGFTPTEEYITAAEWTRLFHPDDVARLVTESARAYREKNKFQFEFRAVCPNGETKWILSHGRILRDANGRAVRMIGMHVDVTGRKQADLARRRSEERFTAFFHSSAVGAARTDPQTGRFLEVNQKLCEMTGYSREELEARTFVDITHPDDRAMTLRSLEEKREEKLPVYSGDKRYIRKDGETIWVHVAANRASNERGEPSSYVGVISDITDRKNSEQSTNLLAAIVDSSDDAIISKNLDGTITSWNKAAGRLFGYTAEEAVGRPITLIIPTDRRDEEVEILARLRRGEQIDHFETIRQRKDGGLLDISVTISPVRDGSGRVVGASKVARDVTNKKRTERALATGVRQQKALFHLADDLHRAASLQEIYRVALNAILSALQCDRASILLCDDNGVMRFVSWRELSQAYRAAVEGHSVWSQDETNPQPIHTSDIDSAEIGESLKATVKSEGIAALAFIPLVSGGKLVGKFMAYFNAPHAFSTGELELGLTIARQLAFAIDRKRSDEALRQSEERFRNLSETLDAEVRARTRELEENNADLLEQSERIRQLSARLLQTQDEERRRIARDLHDSSGQLIAALQMTLMPLEEEGQNLNNSEFAKGIRQSLEFLGQLSKELRTVSYLLHPPLLDEAGLPSAIRWYIEGFAERSKIEVNVELSSDLGRLPREMEMTIFRIVQEALTNIHRHSGSKKADIRLSRSAEEVCLEIQDYGWGMPGSNNGKSSPPLRAGVGIQGMRERARQLHGRVEIDSTENGTLVTVSLPLKTPSMKAEQEKTASVTVE